MTHYLNLVNPDLRPRHAVPSATHVAIAVVIGAAVMSAWAAYAKLDADRAQARAQALESHLKSQRGALATLGKEISERKPDAQLAADLARTERLLEARDEIAKTLDSSSGGAGGPGFSSYLKAFARQSVHGLWLTGFEIGTAGNDMVISGRTLNPELVPGYIRRLNAEKSFQGREFATLTMGVPETPRGAADARAAPAAKPAYLEFNLAGLPAGGPERRP